jgi:hypothetical protein
MVRKAFKPEKIINRFREAEVLIGQGFSIPYSVVGGEGFEPSTPTLSE